MSTPRDHPITDKVGDPDSLYSFHCHRGGHIPAQPRILPVECNCDGICDVALFVLAQRADAADRRCDQVTAFRTWAEQIDAWWPKGHSRSGDPGTMVFLERQVGGRLYERTQEGVEYAWGEVIAWDPPRHLTPRPMVLRTFRWRKSSAGSCYR
jgi:hypothetical protein